MPSNENDDDEIKDLIKRKTKLLKDASRLGELGDTIFQLGYIYFQKGYYNEALEEFENALAVRRKLANSVDIANTHRFLGETLCKLERDFDRAKSEFDRYFSITLHINDLVEIQRAHTTLGNYYMALIWNESLRSKRTQNLNDAYSHYLKSYDLLDEIGYKRLVDAKELDLMKARTCLNCAVVLDEKRDLVICTEYLKTAIELCEKNHFYEDLIRCYYIKCEQAKRKNKMEETLRVADKIVEIANKSKDLVQKSQDYLFVAEIYLRIQNFEKAKYLLRKAYSLRRKCLIPKEIKLKLKQIIDIIHLQRDLNKITNSTADADADATAKLHEKIADACCNLGLFDLGLENYQKQLDYAKTVHQGDKELSLIYASIAQTCQDLDDLNQSIKFYNLELESLIKLADWASAAKSLINVAIIKEKLNGEYCELESIYLKAFSYAEKAADTKLQLKCIRLLKESMKSLKIDSTESKNLIDLLMETVKTTKSMFNSSSSDDEEDDDDQSLVFTSESENEHQINNDDESTTLIGKQTSAAANKKYIVRRNLRGETQLHVACIKGNYKLAKKLIEEGHPINERDNLNWLPIHEACNYGHVELVDMLIKHGAKINDLLGPITPLHDACQNGHFEVSKLLLKSGAFSYVFTSDGYTPLDFLVKYKEENEKEFSGDRMKLFKEIYEIMLESIRGKDRNYKIKRVVITEETNYVASNDQQMNNDDDYDDENAENGKFRRNKKQHQHLIADLDDDVEYDGDDKKDSNKKVAIRDYKNAIKSIGSKSLINSNKSGNINKTGSGKTEHAAIVSENEYNMADSWLIDDMMMNNKKSSSTKRKLPNNDHDDVDESINKIDHFNNNYDFELDLFNHYEIGVERLSDAKSRSKKRVIESESSSIDNQVVEIMNGLTNNCNKDNNSDDLEIIESPFKSLTSRSIINLNSLHQQKLTKMKNNKFKTLNEQQEIKMKRNLSNLDLNLKTDTTTTAAIWKLKAVVDKTNFLIPISNINLTIDDLTEQILTRYKLINANEEASFREPDKVLLKSSDDLILFGQDLIRDVLSNQSQVQLIIKSWKDAPTIAQLYEKLCTTQQLSCYENIKKLLNQSESTNELNMSMILNENLLAPQQHQHRHQFELIFDAIKLNTIQNSSVMHCDDSITTSVTISSLPYFKSLHKIDFSSNMLGDSLVVSFFNGILSECVNLKHLDLSFNMITQSSIKAFNDVMMAKSGSNNFFLLEHLNLNGNHFGAGGSITERKVMTAMTTNLTNLVQSHRALKTLWLADCKLNLAKCGCDDENDDAASASSLKRLLSAIKNSKLVDLDFSLNYFDHKYLIELLENVPSQQLECINISNCCRYKLNDKITQSQNFKFELANSISKFSWFYLKKFSLRDLKLNIEQTSEIINAICTSNNKTNLMHLDLSYNSFDDYSVKSLFTECKKLDEIFLVNNLSLPNKYSSVQTQSVIRLDDFDRENGDEENCCCDWLEIIKYRFNDTTCAPVKQLEICLIRNFEQLNEIKSIFKRKWQRDSLKLLFSLNGIVEFRIDEKNSF